MIAPYHRMQCVSERHFPGFRVELVNYEWDPQAEIVHFEREIVLRLRLAPERLQAVGVVDDDCAAMLGRLIVRPPHVESRARGSAVKESASVVNCRFDPAWIERMIGAEHAVCLSQLSHELDLHNGDLLRTMHRIAEEIANPSYCSDTMIEAFAVAASVDLFRHRMIQNERSQFQDGGLLGSKRLKQVRDFVESSLERSPTITEIAGEIGISSAHLRRLFKNSTGQTLHTFVEETRIAQARNLLANTNLPLKVISYKVGFSQPSAFSAAFRKSTGESPSQYRDRSSIYLPMADEPGSSAPTVQ